MPVNELLLAAVLAWLAAAILALAGLHRPGRLLLVIGCALALAGCVLGLPAGTAPVTLPLGIAGQGTPFALRPEALWLMGFGLAPALLAAVLGSPSPDGARGWVVGAGVSLIGALGVFGVGEGAAFLVAWELMSLGGAIMLLAERLAPETGRPVLSMLALLEVGAVALLLAILILGHRAGSLDLDAFPTAAQELSPGWGLVVGVLLLIGFGAKLGLLPFYEWFPGAYGSGSGATAALLSGVVLNAAFFGLLRGLGEWLPDLMPATAFATLVIGAGVISAILAALYAFQQEDWRHLLSFSSAENGSIAVTLMGASLLFSADGLTELGGLAWTVALIHLAAHALAKSTLFLAADGVYRSTGRYAIVQGGLLGRGGWLFGLGALFAAMSLAAMPPLAGFVSEWFLFQTVFQGFHLPDLGGRLVLALAGAGLALSVAIAFATFVKVFGIGLLGRGTQGSTHRPTGAAVGLQGLLVLALAAGMPVWLKALGPATVGHFSADVAARMSDGWLLVPLTATFAFISPSKLVIVMPLLALLPIGLLLLGARGVRRAPVWYGGCPQDAERSATTALAFSNALRTFYSFVYRPVVRVERELARGSNGQPYFVRRLDLTHEVQPIFERRLFVPIVALVNAASTRMRMLQSGSLNFYQALIGLLLVAILLVLLI